MSPVEAVKSCLSKYATFGGRAVRSEYWYFYLFTLIVGIGAALLDYSLGIEALADGVNFAFLVPTLAAGSRRLHDVGRTGWLQALILIPFVVIIWSPLIAFGLLLAVLLVLLFLMAKPGTSGPNRYGADPQNPTDAAIFA